MQVTGYVGQPTKQFDGTQPIVRQGSLGELVVQKLHGDFYEQSYRGNSYAVANQAGVSTTAALATTWTGLAISNPSGSGVNLVVNRFTCAQVAAGVAGAVGIMTGAGSAAGSLTPRNRIVSGPASKAVASAGATIGAPVLEEVYGSLGSLATTGYGLQSALIVPINGSLIVPPGYFAASYTTAATTTALIFGFLWEEVPV